MKIEFERVAGIVQEVCSQAGLGPQDYDRPLKDLGVDSLDVAGIFLSIQEELGIRVPDDDIDRLDTIRRITDYLNRGDRGA